MSIQIAISGQWRFWAEIESKLDRTFLWSRTKTMPNIVFFAWQLDTPAEHNKKFIWEALKQATQGASTVAKPELSPRPETDIQGVPGSPNIVQTIFERIRECSIFLADLSFVGSTANGKKIPNPNVLIELGYAARSIGWDRTILVLNSAFGPGKDLPFDILQHRWPLEYRLTEQTEVAEQRFDKLAEELAAAISECEQHSLIRATEMAEALDTATLDFIAQNETSQLLEMPLPSKTMGQLLTGLDHILAARRLIELGALRVTNKPRVGYMWTHDGQRMIEEINKKHRGLLHVLRQHRIKGDAN